MSFRPCALLALLVITLTTARLSAAEPSDDFRDVVENYSADRQDIARRYRVSHSADAEARLAQFYRQWREQLAELDFDALPQAAKIDYLLLDNHIRREERQLELDAQARRDIEPLVPFLGEIAELEMTRRRFEFVDGQAAAEGLTKLAERVEAARKAVAEQLEGDEEDRPKATAGRQAAIALNDSMRTLRGWYDFYHGYDPLVSWWIEAPYEKLRTALEDYSRYLRREVAGLREGDNDTILGRPIGKSALESELAAEMIPYSPERLIELAEREFKWCEEQMIAASRDLGYGDDWKQALEHTKQQYVPPGEQTQLIRELHDEAVQFLEVRNLITIPPLAKEVWSMEMMTPERQRVNPFFTGGETISVSYPTTEMSHEDKLMSMRGNNKHFARATVHHELIPGHRLQAYMTARYRTHRGPFRTPFWTEGWALYWEMQLWDLDFPRTPEERIGMLFWRMHRCARIIFSLRFHMEEMTAAECVDFLVDRVGHERQNAAGEVRRSFETSYGPLYQAAYMLGGLQIRALYRELVESGKMTPREFHDAVMHENCIPIAMVRASLTNQELSRDYKPDWRFDD
jgi:uncharacterized protein (DUF885 family)